MVEGKLIWHCPGGATVFVHNHAFFYASMTGSFASGQAGAAGFQVAAAGAGFALAVA